MCISCKKKKSNFYEIVNIFIGPPCSDLVTPLHQAAGKCLLRKKPRLHKPEYISHFFPSPYNFLFLNSTISDSQNSSKPFIEPHCVYAVFVPNLFTYLSLTFLVCSTCIFSIHPSSTCTMLSDLLVSAIYNLCLKSSTMPHILHSPTASLLPLWPIQNSFHLKDYIPSPQIFFQGSLPLSFQLLLFNLLPYAYFYTLLSFVFMQSFHSSSMKKSLITLHLNCSLKH